MTTMITTVPFSPELATELAEREAALEATRSARIAGAQALLRQTSTPMVEREVTVLVPYTTFEGKTKHLRVKRMRTLPIILR